MLIVVIDDPYDRFRYNRQAYEMPVGGGHPPHQFTPLTLKRLLRAYGALTTDEARMAAIRTIEALAAPERQLAPA